MPLTHYDEAILEELLGYGRDERSNLEGIVNRLNILAPGTPEPRRERPEGHKAHCQCPECRVELMSVHPDESSERQPPDTERMQRRAEADRRLRVVRLLNPIHARVLAAYHGDAGHKAGRTKWTRIAAVVPYTEAGKRLAKREAKKERGTGDKRTDAQRVEVALTLAEAQPQASVKQLIDLAMREAEELYKLACEAFASTAKRGRT